jgi:hypothetical protein
LWHSYPYKWSHSHHILITLSSHSHHTLITLSSHSHHTLITLSSHSHHTHHTLITLSSHSHHTLIILSSLSHHSLITLSSLSSLSSLLSLSTELYVLEHCGHFFCPQCLYSYARQQLDQYKTKKMELENANSVQKRQYQEVLCPLPSDVCGFAISSADLRVGLQQFSHFHYEQFELV